MKTSKSLPPLGNFFFSNEGFPLAPKPKTINPFYNTDPQYK